MHKFIANSLFIGKKVKILPHCHSTNQVAAELLANTSPIEGSVIITDNQTAGRGQRGHQWESAPGKNLTLSIITYPGFLKIDDQFYLNMIVSLAVADVLRDEFGPDVRVKWPNDVYVGEKKICGILIENGIRGTHIEYSILGIGLNINQTRFLAAKATSMSELSLSEYDLGDVFNRVVNAIEKRYLSLRGGDLENIRKNYLSNLYWINETHLFESNGIFSGQIEGIDSKGNLVVKSNGQASTYGIKEIRFVR